MNTKVRNLSIALTLAVALLAGFALGGYQTKHVAEASAVDGYAQYTWTYNGIIASANGTGKFTGDYGRFECYATADVSDTQVVKLKFESSPDNANFAAQPVWQFSSNVLAVIDDFADVSTDSTVFGITVLEGLYTRPVLTLSEINPVTVTLRCIGKDRPGYDLDQEAGAHEATD
jgi:hypothetical protein